MKITLSIKSESSSVPVKADAKSILTKAILDFSSVLRSSKFGSESEWQKPQFVNSDLGNMVIVQNFRDWGIKELNNLGTPKLNDESLTFLRSACRTLASKFKYFEFEFDFVEKGWMSLVVTLPKKNLVKFKHDIPEFKSGSDYARDKKKLLLTVVDNLKAISKFNKNAVWSKITKLKDPRYDGFLVTFTDYGRWEGKDPNWNDYHEIYDLFKKTVRHRTTIGGDWQFVVSNKKARTYSMAIFDIVEG